MKTLNRVLGLLSLSLLAACHSGGDNPPPAKTIADTLVYTDPTSTSYRLVKNASLSSATHLVLDLVGPSGTNGRGVAFTLSADTTKLTWAKVTASDAALVQNGTAFNLGSGTQILSGKASGDTLQAGLFQKGAAVAAVSLAAPLARVALDLKSGVVPVNTTVTFSAVANKANVLPDTGAPQTITVATGTILAQ